MALGVVLIQDVSTSCCREFNGNSATNGSIVAVDPQALEESRSRSCAAARSISAMPLMPSNGSPGSTQPGGSASSGSEPNSWVSLHASMKPGPGTRTKRRVMAADVPTFGKLSFEVWTLRVAARFPTSQGVPRASTRWRSLRGLLRWGRRQRAVRAEFVSLR